MNPTRCNVCGKDFPTTEAFVIHFESRFDHYQVFGTHEWEYEAR